MVTTYFLLGLEGGRSRERVKPEEDTIERHEIVGGICHTNSRDSSPGEEGGSSKWDAGEEKALESENNGRVLHLNPLKLEGAPYTNQEIGFCAQKSSEDSKREGVEDGEEGRAEEKGDLGSDEREPDGKESSRFEIERVEYVRDHKAKGKSGDDRSTAKVEEEGGTGDKGDGDPAIVGEGGGRVPRIR